MEGYKPNGKPKYIRVRCKTEKQATAEKNAMIAKLAAGRKIVTSALTVGSWLETWLEEYVKPSNKPRTLEYYSGIVRNWIIPTLGTTPLKNLKAIDVDRLLAKGKAGLLSVPRTDENGNVIRKSLSYDSLRGIRNTLRRSCNIAIRKGHLAENPVYQTEPPKQEQREVVHLTTDQVVKLFEKCADPKAEFGTLVYLGLNTGMRIGELLGLTWDNVDLESEEISVTQQLQRIDKAFRLTDLKTGTKTRRRLALSAAAAEALRAHKSRKDAASQPCEHRLPSLGDLLVFTTSEGKPIHAKDIDTGLKALCKSAGVPPVSFHKLRHTVATRMAESGIPLDVIRDQLGHSQISLTINTYRHFIPAKQRQAVETLAGLYDEAAKRHKEKT